jgi:hypothetical protein
MSGRELKLKPGWFTDGVRRAAQRVDEWSSLPINKARVALREKEDSAEQADAQEEHLTTEGRRAS